MNELKPCPFCGSDDVGPITFKGCDGVVWDEFIACGGCGATAETAEAWNTRVERTCRLDANDVCSSCGACIQRITHSVYEMGDGFACSPKYCPNCGAKVVVE